LLSMNSVAHNGCVLLPDLRVNKVECVLFIVMNSGSGWKISMIGGQAARANDKGSLALILSSPDSKILISVALDSHMLNYACTGTVY
jgi:hypothetical protein